MVSVAMLMEIPFFQDLPPALLDRLAAVADERDFEPNAVIIRQHDEAQSLFFLMDGTVEFLIHFEGVDDLLVATASSRGEPIGWSIAREPFRYTTSVKCTTACRLLRLPRQPLFELLEETPEFGVVFLRRLSKTLADRVDQARDLLTAAPGTVDDTREMADGEHA